MWVKKLSRTGLYKILIITLLTLFTALYVMAVSPTQTTPTIDSSDSSTNNTFADLIVTNQSTADADGDIVYNSITWLLNNETNISSIKPDDPNLVVFLPMDGNSTEELMDYAGADDNSSTNGYYLPDGLFNGGYTVENDSNNNARTIAIEQSQNFNVSNTNNFTINIGFKMNTRHDDTDFAFPEAFRIGTTIQFWWNNVTGIMNFKWWNQTGLAIQTLASTTQLKQGNWYYLTFTFQDNGIAKAYVNGVLEDTDTYPGMLLLDQINNTIELGLGCTNCSFDEFSLYNKTLSDSDVFNLYEVYHYGNFTLNNTYTATGEFWKAEITPYDYTSRGVPQNTSELEIMGCDTPSDGMQIVRDTVLCNSEMDYYLNGSTSGVINIANDNTILDCNYSKFIGNGSIGNVGLYAFNKYNITIKNCYFENYDAYNIYLSQVNATLINNTLNNTAQYLLLVENSQGDINSFNNTYSSAGISAINLGFTGIQGNFISDGDYFSDNRYYAFNRQTQTAGFSNLIINNTIIENNSLLSADNFTNIWVENTVQFGEINRSDNNFIIDVKNSTSITILNVSHTNMRGYLNIEYSQDIWLENLNLKNSTTHQFIQITDDTTNITILNSILNGSDSGIRIGRNVSNVVISDVYFYEMITGYDAFNTGLRFEYNSSNLTFENSTIEFGTLGILLRQLPEGNITIRNITFLDYSMAEKQNNNINDHYEIPCDIGIVELYKTWTGDNSESLTDNLTNKIEDYYSNDILIEDNTYAPNSACMLYTQNTTNLVHDLTNYSFISFQFPDYLVDRTDLYLNSSYNNISRYSNGVYELVSQGYMNTIFVNITISNDFKQFINNNDTQTYMLNLYNLSGQDIKWFNGSVSHSNVSGSVASVVLLPGESVNVSDAVSCNPVTDANWVIGDDRFCANNEELNIGKGNITILPGGFLTLTQGTNLTAEHLEYQRTGDAVAVNKGSELIIKGSK